MSGRASASASGPVLVAGASGYLGRYVVAELARRSIPVRALVRDRGRAQAAGPFGSPALEGLVTKWRVVRAPDPAGLAGVAQGCTRVISALGVTRQRADPWDVDFLSNLRLLREAETCGKDDGTPVFTYVSALGAQSSTAPVLRAKRALEEALTRSRVLGQAVRPTGYFSDAEAFLQMARRGRVWLVGEGSARFNPIHGADLAAFIIDLPRQRGLWSVGGPDALTYRQAGLLAFRALGTRPRFGCVPEPAARAAITAAARVSPRIAGVGQFMVDSLTRDSLGEPTGSHHLAEHFRRRAGAEA